jgi:hypothetical protein
MLTLTVQNWIKHQSGQPGAVSVRLVVTKGQNAFKVGWFHYESGPPWLIVSNLRYKSTFKPPVWQKCFPLLPVIASRQCSIMNIFPCGWKGKKAIPTSSALAVIDTSLLLVGVPSSNCSTYHYVECNLHFSEAENSVVCVYTLFN